jgi:hypothetical protein
MPDGKTTELTADRVILGRRHRAGQCRESRARRRLASRTRRRGCVVTDGYRQDRASRASMPSATCRRPADGSPTRPMHEARHLRREAIAGLPIVHPLDVSSRSPAAPIATPQVASVGLTEAKAKAEPATRTSASDASPIVGQRQGDRASARTQGLVKTDVRRQDRRAARRAHDRRGSDRADPGLTPSPRRWRRPRST